MILIKLYSKKLGQKYSERHNQYYKKHIFSAAIIIVINNLQLGLIIYCYFITHALRFTLKT